VSGLDLFTTANAWASAAGAEHHTPSIGEVVFPAINFIIYAADLYYFALPAVRSFLRSRREDVVSTMAQATAKKQQAEALVSEYRSKLGAVDQEIRSIQTSFRAAGEMEKSKMVSEAQVLATKLREDARFLADQEVKMARQKIREEMARQAEATARELVQRNISATDQGRLAQDFIQSLGQAR
jgi:F-type H+-transporting ATPase subunit b